MAKSMAEKLENQVRYGLITQVEADDRLSRANREDEITALNAEVSRLFELELDVQMAALIDSKLKRRILRVINDRSEAIEAQIAAMG